MSFPDDEWLRGHQWTPEEIETMLLVPGMVPSDLDPWPSVEPMNVILEEKAMRCWECMSEDGRRRTRDGRNYIYCDACWSGGKQENPEMSMVVKENSFFVTTEPPRTAEFTDLLDPERFGEPLEDPGYDPYNSLDRTGPQFAWRHSEVLSVPAALDAVGELAL